MSLSPRKKQSIRFAGLQTAGYLVGTILNIPVRFVTAAVLGPGTLGGLRAVELVIRYATCANLGLINGYRKQYTHAFSAGHEEAATEIDRVGFTGIMLSSLASLVVVLVIYLAGIDVGGVFTLHLMILVMGILVLGRLHSYLLARAESQGRFDLSGLVTILLRVATPIYTIIGVLLLGVDGIVVAWLLIPLTCAVTLWLQQRDFFLRLYLQWQRLKSIVTVGGLQYLDGVFTNLILTMGSMLAVFYLDADQFGLYAFAEGSFNMSRSLPLSLQTLFFKNMVDIHIEGKDTSGGTLRHMRTLFKSPLTLFILLTTLIAGAAYLAYQYAIALLLPQFTASIPLMGILLFAQTLYATQGIITQYFVATDQIGLSATLSGLWALFSFVFVTAALTQHATLPVLALSSALGLFGYATLFISIALVQTRGPKAAIWVQARYWLINGLLCGAALVMGAIHCIPAHTGSVAAEGVVGAVELIVKLALFGAMAIVGFGVTFAEQRIFHEMRQIAGYAWQIVSARLPSVRRS